MTMHEVIKVCTWSFIKIEGEGGGGGDLKQNKAQSTHEDVALVEFMSLAFTHISGESYLRWFRSFLLYFFYVFWAQINSLVC